MFKYFGIGKMMEWFLFFNFKYQFKFINNINYNMCRKRNS